jgi:hypothetical protein
MLKKSGRWDFKNPCACFFSEASKNHKDAFNSPRRESN